MLPRGLSDPLLDAGSTWGRQVLLWEDGALSPGQLDAWQATRRELLARMRDAGIKGARGTLAKLGAELRELSTRAVITPLSTCAQASLSLTRVGALAAKLQREDQVLVYNFIYLWKFIEQPILKPDAGKA